MAGDVLDYAEFFVRDEDVAYDEKAFEKRLRKPPDAARLLAALRERLVDAETFEAAPLEELTRAFVERQGVKLGQIVHALRVAVTGKAVGFGMFDTLAVLGRERCLARIDRALDRVRDPSGAR